MGHVSLVRNSHLQHKMEHGILWLGIRSSNIQWALFALVGNPQLQHTMGHVSFNWNSQLQQTIEHDCVWLGIQVLAGKLRPHHTVRHVSLVGNSQLHHTMEHHLFPAGTAHLQHTMDMILCFQRTIKLVT